MTRFTFLTRIFLFLSVLLFNFNLYSLWHAQYSGVSSNLNAVHFINSNTGFVCGNDGVILKTVDKGASWVRMNSGTSNTLYSIKFISLFAGFACGDNIILKTADGGATWQSYTSGITTSLRTIFPVNENIIYTAGTGGVIYRSVNGGNSWSINHTTANSTLTSVYFLNSNTGYVTGYAGKFMKTIDGGVTWTSKSADASKNFYAVQFLNAGKGFIIGGWHASTILRSNDGGENWDNLLSGGTGVRLFSGSFLDEEKGYACGRYGTVMKTDNSGETWNVEATNVTSHLNGIQYVNEQTAYSVGDNGVIISTVSVIGINQISSNVPEKFLLEQNYPNPFNPVTKIRFAVPKSSYVNISVYNMLGEKVNELVAQDLSPGSYETDMDASALSSGTYFYAITAGDFRETKKMILVK